MTDNMEARKDVVAQSSTEGANSTDRLATKLSPTQIENWRKVLCTTLGPYALIMPAEQVQAMKDKMQGDLNKLGG